MASQAGNDIRSLFAFVLRHPLLLAFGGFGGMLSFLLLFGAVFPPSYVAEVQVRISASLPSRVNTTSRLNLEDINAAKARAATCAEVLKEPSLYQSVIQNNSLPYTVEQLQKKVQIVRKTDTEIISLRITSRSAQEARSLAEQFGRTVPNFLTYSVRTGSASTVTSEYIPLEEDRPPLWLLTAAGLPFGSAAATASMVLWKLLLDLVICREDLLARYDCPVLAEIPEKGPARQRAVGDCAGFLFHLHPHPHPHPHPSKPEKRPHVLRLVSLGKNAGMQPVCRALAGAVSQNSGAPALLLSPASAEESPGGGEPSDIWEYKPNLFLCTLPGRRKVHSFLAGLPPEYAGILIQDSFQKGTFRAAPVQPKEQVVLVVERDRTTHGQIRHCLERLGLLQASVRGIILLI